MLFVQRERDLCVHPAQPQQPEHDELGSGEVEFEMLHSYMTLFLGQDSAKSVQFESFHSPAPRLNRQYVSIDNTGLLTPPVVAL